MLDAADALIRADASSTVTMEAVAAAAGVGKASLFRAFGDRTGLLDALSAAKFRPLREAVEQETDGFAPEVPAATRIAELLDAVLVFKLENRNLMRLREGLGGGDLRSDRYLWMHTVLSGLVEQATSTPPGPASYCAHALLALVRIDLLDEVLPADGALDDVRRQQAQHVAAVLGSVEPAGPSGD